MAGGSLDKILTAGLDKMSSSLDKMPKGNGGKQADGGNARKEEAENVPAEESTCKRGEEKKSTNGGGGDPASIGEGANASPSSTRTFPPSNEGPAMKSSSLGERMSQKLTKQLSVIVRGEGGGAMDWFHSLKQPFLPRASEKLQMESGNQELQVESGKQEEELQTESARNEDELQTESRNGEEELQTESRNEQSKDRKKYLIGSYNPEDVELVLQPFPWGKGEEKDCLGEELEAEPSVGQSVGQSVGITMVNVFDSADLSVLPEANEEGSGEEGMCLADDELNKMVDCLTSDVNNTNGSEINSGNVSFGNIENFKEKDGGNVGVGNTEKEKNGGNVGVGNTEKAENGGNVGGGNVGGGNIEKEVNGTRKTGDKTNEKEINGINSSSGNGVVILRDGLGIAAGTAEVTEERASALVLVGSGSVAATSTSTSLVSVLPGSAAAVAAASAGTSMVSAGSGSVAAAAAAAAPTAASASASVLKGATVRPHHVAQRRRDEKGPEAGACVGGRGGGGGGENITAAAGSTFSATEVCTSAKNSTRGSSSSTSSNSAITTLLYPCDRQHRVLYPPACGFNPIRINCGKRITPAQDKSVSQDKESSSFWVSSSTIKALSSPANGAAAGGKGGGSYHALPSRQNSTAVPPVSTPIPGSHPHSSPSSSSSSAFTASTASSISHPHSSPSSSSSSAFTASTASSISLDSKDKSDMDGLQGGTSSSSREERLGVENRKQLAVAGSQRGERTGVEDGAVTGGVADMTRSSQGGILKQHQLGEGEVKRRAFPSPPSILTPSPPPPPQPLLGQRFEPKRGQKGGGPGLLGGGRGNNAPGGSRMMGAAAAAAGLTSTPGPLSPCPARGYAAAVGRSLVRPPPYQGKDKFDEVSPSYPGRNKQSNYDLNEVTVENRAERVGVRRSEEGCASAAGAGDDALGNETGLPLLVEEMVQDLWEENEDPSVPIRTGEAAASRDEDDPTVVAAASLDTKRSAGGGVGITRRVSAVGSGGGMKRIGGEGGIRDGGGGGGGGTRQALGVRTPAVSFAAAAEGQRSLRRDEPGSLSPPSVTTHQSHIPLPLGYRRGLPGMIAEEEGAVATPAGGGGGGGGDSASSIAEGVLAMAGRPGGHVPFQQIRQAGPRGVSAGGGGGLGSLGAAAGGVAAGGAAGGGGGGGGGYNVGTSRATGLSAAASQSLTVVPHRHSPTFRQAGGPGSGSGYPVGSGLHASPYLSPSLQASLTPILGGGGMGMAAMAAQFGRRPSSPTNTVEVAEAAAAGPAMGGRAGGASTGTVMTGPAAVSPRADSGPGTAAGASMAKTGLSLDTVGGAADGSCGTGPTVPAGAATGSGIGSIAPVMLMPQGIICQSPLMRGQAGHHAHASRMKPGGVVGGGGGGGGGGGSGGLFPALSPSPSPLGIFGGSGGAMGGVGGGGGGGDGSLLDLQEMQQELLYGAAGFGPIRGAPSPTGITAEQYGKFQHQLQQQHHMAAAQSQHQLLQAAAAAAAAAAAGGGGGGGAGFIPQAPPSPSSYQLFLQQQQQQQQQQQVDRRSAMKLTMAGPGGPVAIGRGSNSGPGTAFQPGTGNSGPGVAGPAGHLGIINTSGNAAGFNGSMSSPLGGGGGGGGGVIGGGRMGPQSRGPHNALTLAGGGNGISMANPLGGGVSAAGSRSPHRTNGGPGSGSGPSGGSTVISGPRSMMLRLPVLQIPGAYDRHAVSGQESTSRELTTPSGIGTGDGTPSAPGLMHVGSCRILPMQQLSACSAGVGMGGGAGGGGVPGVVISPPLSPSDAGAVASSGALTATTPTTPQSPHSLYKTELCRSWEETGTCRYGGKCQFAHGKEELRPVARHPKYKTEICRTFSSNGTCPYGTRCRFIHYRTALQPDPPSPVSSPCARPASCAAGAAKLIASSPLKEDDGNMRRLPIFQRLAPGSSESPQFEMTGLASGDHLGQTRFDQQIRATKPGSVDWSARGPAPVGGSPVGGSGNVVSFLRVSAVSEEPLLVTWDLEGAM
ncbi:hypothetical protein CBR_g30215 [Chara braunii]|uniref:C3H1-type domain-containing protein n=1 Tax=Chara braunii TaxID=69332 RepID=A0A388LCM5_CHABU|nr:hypothetical protein CBR_g30215 [Chara braunii]|eukprot:GBG79953.1 hypothetical protein CBR_g30215 [Chara braunii]